VNAQLNSQLPTGVHLCYYSKLEPLQVEDYKVVNVAESSAVGGLYRGREESSPTWQGWFGANGQSVGHPRGRSATSLGLHNLQASDLSLCIDVEMCQPCPGPSGLKADWVAPGPTWPGIWPTWSTCQIHPRGEAYFGIWSTSLCNPLKFSNLVPKFLKSNKH
jgi:hypothetical protein